tara:strand:- start:153 stop:974 length:822 start_codon:yes stop_codon:yes gene_type:complete
MQYVGAPIVWAAQIVGENTSIISQNAAAVASNVTYWMGKETFYMYDGTVRNLRCDVKKYIFTDINTDNVAQIFAGTNEAFNEVWWFYPSADSTTTNRYVIYNYVENIWYYGNITRTAWLDSGIRDNPVAATSNNKIVEHEVGVDDNETATATAITASITSAQQDLDDGHRFMFISKMIPDVSFDGSTAESPVVTMSLLPLKNSGSGYNSPVSEGGNSEGTVTRTATVPVEKFTDQVFLRIRGRQLSFKIESTGLGTTWQLGSPRLDIRADGRR